MPSTACNVLSDRVLKLGAAACWAKGRVKVDEAATLFATRPEGTGMGLAISRSIVESHGGRLWLTPNRKRGVTFHFTLPKAKYRSDGNKH